MHQIILLILCASLQLLLLQCDRENELSAGEGFHTKDFSSLAPYQLVGLPTNSLITEHDFLEFLEAEHLEQ